MNTMTLRSSADLTVWLSEVKYRGWVGNVDPMPDEFPCVVAWTFEDRSFRGYADAVLFEFVYLRDFEP